MLRIYAAPLEKFSSLLRPCETEFGSLDLVMPVPVVSVLSTIVSVYVFLLV